MVQTNSGTDSKPHDFDTSLGKDIKTGEDIWISQNARRSGQLILGSTGYGKSGLINHMVASDMRQVIRRKGGREEHIGICVIAGDGDLIDGIISRVPKHREKDVILLDPIALAKSDGYFAINLFACPTPSDPVLFELTVEQVISVFEKLFTMSEATPMLLDYIQAITRTFVGTPYTMLEISSLLTKDTFRKQVIDPSNDFWEEYNSMQQRERREEYRSTIRRVRNLTENRILKYIIGQSAMFDFEKAINKNKILLINLGGEFKHLGRLLGGIVIGQILLTLLQRKNTPRSERGFFNLYIDEFQNYVSPTINKMATECRKYGLGLTVAHQSTEQEGITDEIKATTRQVGSKVFFRLSNIDATEVADVFDITPPLAVKPPPVIPANVLDHLYRHPHEAVKFFWRQYVQRWEEAARKTEKERIKTYTVSSPLHEDAYEETIISYPDYDLGEGVISFAQRDIEEILLHLNDLLYETQITGTVPTQKRITLIKRLAPLLFFPTFFKYSYSGAGYYSFEQTLRDMCQTGEEDIARQEAVIAEKEKSLTSDDAFLSLQLQGLWSIRARRYEGKEKDSDDTWLAERICKEFQRDDITLGRVCGPTKEALWISLQRAAWENKRLEPFTKYEQWIVPRKAMLQKRLEQLQTKRTKETIRLAPYARVQEEYRQVVRVRPVPFSWFMKRCIYAILLCIVAVWFFNIVSAAFSENLPWSSGSILWALAFGIIGLLAGIWACYLFISTFRRTIDINHPQRPIVPGNPYGEKYAFLSSMALNPTWRRELVLCRAPLFTMPILWPPPGFFGRLFSNDPSPADLASLDFSSCESIVKLDETIATIQRHLQSDDGIASYDFREGPFYATNVSSLQSLADTCLSYSSYDTAERILAFNKELYRIEVIKPLQDEVATAKNKLSSDLAALQAKLLKEKAPHDRFVDALDAVLSVFSTAEGRIAIPSTEWVDTPISQQTHADREREISNTLTHLPFRHAMISIPTGEYTIKTHDIPAVADISSKKDRILDDTKRQYCKSRSEVEREIANRIRPDDPPPTQRKHTL